jgi:acyl carrier protein
MDDILERLQPIFRDVLDNPHVVITRSSSGLNTDGWDSLAHINIVTAIEHEFSIRFALGELNELKDVGEMIDLMVRKLKK